MKAARVGASDTHKLESAKGVTNQENERNEREALTNWKPAMKGQVRRDEEKELSRSTHRLGSTEGRTNQESERERKARNSHAGERRGGGDESEHRKKASERARGTHILGRAEGGKTQGSERKRRRRGTHFLSIQREGQVRSANESEQVGDTDFLESAEGVTG
jgi:hypothetical protein